MMAKFEVISIDNQLVQPWRNGRGETRQIAIWPRDARFQADDFEWRISTAWVNESGPFSTFKNFERHLMLLEGEGLEIHGDRKTLRPTMLDPVEFSGDLQVIGELQLGPVRDFNVFAQRGRWSAKLRIEKLEFGACMSFSPNTATWIIFAADADLHMQVSSSNEKSEPSKLRVKQEQFGIRIHEALLVHDWYLGSSVEIMLTQRKQRPARVIFVELQPYGSD